MSLDQRKDMLWRVYLIYIGACVFGLFILYKIIEIQFIEGEMWRKKSSELTTELKKIDAVRGNIYSHNDRLLATSVPVYEIRMDVNADALTDKVFDANVGPLADSLSNIFQRKSKSAWERELIKARNEGDRYHLVKRRVDYNELQRLKTFPLWKRGRYKGGFIAVQENIRKRPFKVLAARTIGYERKGVQPVGLEGAFSSELSGISGKRLMKRISGGVWMPIGEENQVEPEDGKDVYTTIDINIQDVAERALLHQLKKHKADHGCVVLMEVETGHIKAIANLSRSPKGGYYENYNYAVGESTEPGSTFKLPALMAALEDDRVEVTDSVDTKDGTHEYYDQVMRDAHKGGFGKVSVRTAFEKSSNVGISRVIHRSYAKAPQGFVDRLHKMHLDDKLGLRIAGEGEPVIKDTDDPTWSGVTLPWMSIGYEVRQTPLQILTFYNAVANGGAMVKPKFVKELRDKGRVVKEYEPSVIDEAICSKETVKEAQELLEGVVERGTATNLKNANFKIAGKTGTAQIANDRYGYQYDSEVSYQASFVGYFPAEDPKYSCIVVVNAPSENVYYGNLVAGPIFREIADKVYANSIRIQEPVNKDKGKEEKDILVQKGLPKATHGNKKDLETVLDALGVPYSSPGPDADWVVSLTRKDKVEMGVRSVKNNEVPDVKGMGLQDALYLLENRGLRVEIQGSGKVQEQSVEPGTSLKNVDRIKIELS